MRGNLLSSLVVHVLSLATGCAGTAQRMEVVKATTPEDDRKPNSSAVPDVYALSGRFERVVIFRLKYDVDLLAGIEGEIEKQGIRNAVILSGIGSVRGEHIHTVSNDSFPSRNIYVKDLHSPADIQAINGYVIDGRVHAHVVLANPDRSFGGHLEPETRVFTFAVVTLGVLGEGIDLSRVDDKTHR
jgi:predicted DNA-binding protein with PD1-like motif